MIFPLDFSKYLRGLIFPLSRELEMEDLVASQIGEALGDDSLVEYVAGLLADAPDEEESSEAVADFLQSAGELDEAAAQEACAGLFKALRAAGFGAPVGDEAGGSGGGTGVGGRGAGDHGAADEEGGDGGGRRHGGV